MTTKVYDTHYSQKKSLGMSQLSAEIILILIVMARNSSYLLMKLGIGLLTITSGFSISRGGLFYVIGALIYAVHIIMTERFSKEVDLFSAGIIELFVTGILSLFVSLLTEDFVIPQRSSDWVIILSLAVLCSIVGLAIQPQFQQYTTSERYGLFCGMGPVFSCILGVVFLHEQFGIREAAGSVLILGAVFWSTFCGQKNS